MVDIQLDTSDDQKGVSPVIGVILMIAITVIMAAVIGFFVINIGGDLSGSTTSSSVLTEETENGYQLRVQELGESVDELRVQADGEQVATLEQVGEQVEVKAPEDAEITIIQVSGDGETKVTKTVEVDDSSASDVGTVTDSTPTSTPTSTATPTPPANVSGVVQVNPAIEGATVKVLDESGSVVGTTTTGSNGEYSLEVPSSLENGSVVVNVEGYSYNHDSNGSHPLYAGESQPLNTNSDVNFDFTSPSETTVNGNTVLVSYNIAQESDSVKEIANVYQLQAIDSDLDGSYKLVSNIDASVTESWGSWQYGSGDQFQPIGIDLRNFKGSLDGNGYTISGLHINSEGSQYVGLISRTTSGTNPSVSDLDVLNADIDNPNGFTGVLIGQSNSGEYTNIKTSGSLTVSRTAGGAFGEISSGTSLVQNISTSASIDSSERQYEGTDTFGNPVTRTVSPREIGGFAGIIEGSSVTVSDSYATGNVAVTGSSSYDIGGFAGYVGAATIESSYANGTVNGHSEVGGFVGRMAGGTGATITQSYSTGNVVADEVAGGFVGEGTSDSTITNSYTTSNIDVSTNGGGFTSSVYSGSIENAYAAGNLTVGDSNKYGFAGNNASVTNAYWNTETSGASSDPTSATELTTSEMQGASDSNSITFSDPALWNYVSGEYPELAWESN